MGKKVPEPEIRILEMFVDLMESTGSNLKLVHMSIDENFTEELNKKFGHRFNLNELHQATDKCLAHQWLEHRYMGCGNYGDLGITSTGVGVVVSKRRKRSELANRSSAKKTSDYIVEHKGLFIALGALLGLITIILTSIGVYIQSLD